MVHYVTRDKRHRPAMILRFEDEKPRPRATVDLVLFTQPNMDGACPVVGEGHSMAGLTGPSCVHLAIAVRFDPWGVTPGTWHYPEEQRR